MEKRVLKIQEYLRKNGFEKTVNDFKLKTRVYDKKTLFKYDQLISPTLMALPEIQECRGLVLENDTWDVLSMSFIKFFNYGESNAVKINWATAKVLEKLDGSLISIYHDWNEGKWFAATSGMAEGEGMVNNKNNTTFSDLFWDTVNNKYNLNECLLDKDHVYVFELTTPYNIVVKPHGESEATLLTVRNRVTFKELSGKDLEMCAISLGVPLVKSFNLNVSNVDHLLSTFDDMPWSEEGYVVRDGDDNRIKVKNPAYLQVHGLKGKSAEHNIMVIIKTNEIEEFAAVFPDRKEELIKLKENYDKLINSLNEIWDELKLKIPKNISKEEKKKFAIALFETCEKYNIKEFSGMFFKLAQYKVSSVEEYIKEYDNKLLYKIL